MTYEGKLYRFTAAHSAGAWNSGHVTQIKVNGELKEKVPTTRTVNGHALSADVTVTKGDVGLGNVDNTSDENKPISTAQAAVNDAIIGAMFKKYEPTAATFSVWSDMPEASYCNSNPTAFQSSISADLGLNTSYTYQIVRIINRIYLSCPAVKHFFIGQKSDGGTQFWASVDTDVFQNRGTVPTNTDIDTIKTSGIWFLTSSYSYTHSPFGTGIGGVLLVFKYSDNTVLQIGSQAGTGTVMFRTSFAGSFPATWGSNGKQVTNNYTTEHYENTYNITCEPEITTDTNNYLASTGDSTDRTGEIQTMLNNTGICQLGPGDFYVTGIELPTFGMLKGSGPSTRVILASGVTSGYAVKLGNYSVVKDIRIVGATSNYTPVSGVGTRHGILFEATGDASENPTYKYSATVENCFITDFHGGGITCNNTGINWSQCIEATDCHIKRCDAGINVAYRSEFHHFTSINSTDCYYGCICNGGNCLFSNCNFSGNTVGLLIDNESDQSPNNAHGVFSCCKIAHSGGNTGIGIKVIGSDTCENFNGISFDYGHIVVKDCKGIQFSGCRFGKNTVIEIEDSTATIFDACIIRDPSTVTVSNTNSVTHFVNCYDSGTGNIFNPLNE